MKVAKSKRENLLKKIETLEKKATDYEVELKAKRAELLELDKTELYDAAIRNGLSLGAAIEKLSDLQSKSEDSAKNIKVKEDKNEETV